MIDRVWPNAPTTRAPKYADVDTTRGYADIEVTGKDSPEGFKEYIGHIDHVADARGELPMQQAKAIEVKLRVSGTWLAALKLRLLTREVKRLAKQFERLEKRTHVSFIGQGGKADDREAAHN